MARLRAFVAGHLKLVESHPALAEVLTVELRQSTKFMREYKSPAFAKYLRTLTEILAAGQLAGELRPDFDPKLTARAIFGSVDELALSWIVSRKRLDLEEAANQVVRLFLHGLGHADPKDSRP
jgi:TetR/AcrR family fatty acid metabolism transcriptional regulator